MNIRPVEGKPGWFQVVETGDVFDIALAREDDHYDSILIAAGAVAENFNDVFFVNIQNKQPLDCSLRSSSKIPMSEVMYVERVGLQIAEYVGNIDLAPADFKRVAENSYFQFRLGGKDVAQGPSIKFPSGYGLYGNTVETDQGVMSIGTPATAAASKLSREHRLDGNLEVWGQITFHNRQWGVNAGPLTHGVNEMPTLVHAALVRCYVHGRIHQAATNN